MNASESSPALVSENGIRETLTPEETRATIRAAIAAGEKIYVSAPYIAIPCAVLVEEHGGFSAHLDMASLRFRADHVRAIFRTGGSNFLLVTLH